MFYLLFLIVLVLLSAGLMYVKYLNENGRINSQLIEKILKIIVVVWMILYFFNLLLPDGLSFRTGKDEELYFKLTTGKNIYFVLLRWLNDSAFIFLPMAIFSKKKIFVRIVSYFVLAVAFINAMFYFKYMAMYFDTYEDGTLIGAGIRLIRFFSEDFAGLFINKTLRSIYFGVMFMLEITLSLAVLLFNKNVLKFESKKEVKDFFIVLCLLTIMIMPIYAPQYLTLGFASKESFWVFKMFSFTHIVWIILTIGLGVAIYYGLKPLSQENRYLALIAMTLSSFLQFNGIFTCFGEIVTQRYPFQLCNLANAIFIFTILSRNKTLSRFASVTNVLGAFVAYLFCDSSNCGFTYIMNVHYIVEHTWVMLIPILCQKLGIFEPFEKKDVLTVFKGFSFYYLFIFITGGIFTGLLEKTGNSYWSCNYLFMFNKESTTDLLSFVGPLFDMKFYIFNFFPIAMVELLIFVAFSGLSIGLFYLLYFLQTKLEKKQIKNANCSLKDKMNFPGIHIN